MPERRLYRGWLAVFTLLLAVASACAPTSTGAVESGSITLVTGRDPSYSGVYQQLINKWNQQHPATPARIVELPSNSDLERSQMLAAEQSGSTAYDVLNLDVIRTPEFAADGAIQPLNGSILTEDGPNDFLPSSLRSVSYQGQLWGVPFIADAGLLYYRKDLLVGVGDPVPSTWQQMLDTADRVKQKYGGQKPPEAAYVSQLKPYEGLTVNAMEAALSNDEDLTTLPTASKGLENLADYLRQQKVLPSSRGYDEQASLQAFKDGRAVFMRNWPFAYNVLAAEMPTGTSIGVTLLPGGDEKHRGRSVLGGQNLAVAGHTKKPRLARNLIAFLTSGRSEQCLLELGGLAATRRGPYEGSQRCELLPESTPSAGGSETGTVMHSLYKDADARGVLREALEKAQLRPVTPYYPAVTRVIQNTVDEMLQAADSASARRSAEQLPARIGRALDGK